jgi:hypothetical protein
MSFETLLVVSFYCMIFIKITSNCQEKSIYPRLDMHFICLDEILEESFG